MIDTTQEYKDRIASNFQKWTVDATIDYTDYNLDNSIQTTVSPRDRQSDDAQIADGIEVTSFKFFPSWDRFQWGQNYHFRAAESTNKEKGALSEPISDNNQDFNVLAGNVVGFTCVSNLTPFQSYQDYPRFAVTFSERTVTSIKVVFDQLLGEWAVNFDVNIYKGAVLDTTEVVTNNTTYRYQKTLSSPILQATKVEVVVKKWNYILSKAKIVESFTSIQESYDSSDIIEMSIYEETEPTNATIPIGNVTANTCNLKLINIDNTFDNDNPDSVLAGNVIKNRRIKPSATLAEQEIPLGTFYSQKWVINNNRLEAEVSGRDLIALMEDQEYTTSQFITPGSDQNFTYTTTADFNTFTVDNVIVGVNEIILGDAAVPCEGEEITNGKVFGFTCFSDLTLMDAFVYCGTADKLVNYTYTPGTTITATVSFNSDIPTGAAIEIYISYTTIDNFILVENGQLIFTPEDISATSQSLKLRVLMKSQTNNKPSLQDITLTLAEDVTLYSLAAKLIDDFDDITNLVDDFEIDQAFGEIIIPNAYFNPQSFRSFLSTIAEAGAGRAYITRLGALKIESLQQVSTSMKNYTTSNYFEKSQPVNPEELWNRVTVVTQPLKKATSSETIGEPLIEIADGDTINITIFFDEKPAEDIVFSGLPTNVTIDSQTIYTWGADLEISNASGSDQNFTLTVTGKPYRVTGSRRITLDDTESIRKNGVIEYIIDDNELIQTEEQAERITQLMIESFSTLRRVVQVDALPDPSLEIGDSITVDETFYNINSNEIEYRQGLLTHIIGGKS